MAAEPADLNGFRFMPLLEFLSDWRKISRKRFIDGKEINAIFPPERFVAVPFDFEPEDQAGKCSRKAARPTHGHAVSDIISSRDTVAESKDVRVFGIWWCPTF